MRLRLTLLHILLCSAFLASIGAAGASGAEQPERVVYVAPDLGTYLYAISLWDKEKQFPIFIGEGRFLDTFLKGYPGAKVEKLDQKAVGKIDNALVYKVLYAAWGPETLDDAPKSVSRDDLKGRLESLGIVPQGIVMTNTDDAEFAGGVALAAGRRQIVGFCSCSQKRSDKVNVWDNSASERTKELLRNEILGQVKEWGYLYEGLGEGIDYITLALNMPHAFRYERPGTAEKFDPGYAMTDALGRLTASGLVEVETPGGPKKGAPAIYAYCGQLLEAAPQMAVYQAMASLFAETPRALYFHRWISIHGLEGVKGYQVLRTMVHTVNRDQRSDPVATLDQWHRVTDGGHGYGFIHVAAAGDAYHWFDGGVGDIPEGAPCAVYFAQSGSAANPALTDTIAGRWLYNGAYVYYGGAAEPDAASFNAAQVVAQTLARGGTYAEAFQRKDTLHPRFHRPWRLVYLGDPLARPRFVADPDEPEWSQKWRRAAGLLRQAEYRDAVLLMESIYAAVPSGRLDELWQDLLRGYELTLGISSFGLPNPKRYFTPEFIDGWMLPADVAQHRPEVGWQARLHVRLVKDAELSDLLTSRLKVEGMADALKARLRDEAAALDVTATRAKMWLVLGPLKWADAPEGAGPKQVPRDVPSQLPVKNTETYPGADGDVSWKGGLVDAETCLLELAPPRSGAASLYLLATLVHVGGSTPREVRLTLAGTAGTGDPAPVVWVGRKLVQGGGDGGYAVTLQPGVNEIALLVALPQGATEPATFQMSLTEPDGTRSREFKYIDLIQQLRSRSDRPADRRAPPRGQ